MSKFIPLDIPLYGKIKREVVNVDFIKLQNYMQGLAAINPDDPICIEIEIRVECLARFRPCPEC